MRNFIEKLKENLLNEEMTLLELDNMVENITGSETSLFDYPDEIRQNGAANYYIDNDNEIVIEYLADISDEEISNMNSEEKLNIKVEITDIRLY